MLGTSLSGIMMKQQNKMIRFFRSRGIFIPNIDQPRGMELMRIQVDGEWHKVGVEGIDSHEDPEIYWPV